LTGLDEVNYHTLADFRVEKQKELDELFTQVLAALSKEGLLTLEQVMQDGTKIKAQASERARRQQQERLENALQELKKLQERKQGEKAKSKVRVSSSDPQARVMPDSDGGLALSYHAQISADVAHGLIVGVAVTPEVNDYAQVLPAVERVG